MPSNVKIRISFVAMNLLRWQCMMTLILQHTEDAQHRLFLGYEDIMRQQICLQFVTEQEPHRRRRGCFAGVFLRISASILAIV